MWKFVSLCILVLGLIGFNSLLFFINRILHKKNYRLATKIYYIVPSIGMFLSGLLAGKWIISYLL
ncbi:hypothetical protein CS063_00755 [Sporanaerobium hydrogeniformans]|uniref:Uncharacterized protein n=1 Tax=Sporanaerobium hydrogeniformans TaxID=3072179 RepID=A0AC61DGP8_9FIRM|nr:hypothetical protein [Sporanaerobium hydrogeniformans]PHV72040.1 hypothetical protein CS063_00755 [Sporanaerobium hydrogeniformans]